MTFPYDDLPGAQYWRRAFGGPAIEFDPQGATKFQLTPETKIGSAGSCFARRIGASLRAHGLRYRVVEEGPPWLDQERREAYSYGLLSARYGDILTTLQLLQLLQRAMGWLEPIEDAWPTDDGNVLDPFRPVIQPKGFSSLAELHADRLAHLRAVKRLFTDIDVFIFTLGVTEAWCDRRDGAVLPLCPGRGRGTFCPERHVFRNLSVAENVAFLQEFLEIVGVLNPRLRVILSVSPVPLAATMESPHVFRSTIFSKAVLRVAAEIVARRNANVDYFASFEIALAAGFRPPFFEPDGRTVTEDGVAAVMRSFYRNYFGGEPAQAPPLPEADRPAESPARPCDEDLLMAAIEDDLSRD